MSFFAFLEEKTAEILFQLFFLAAVVFLLFFYGVDLLFILLLIGLFTVVQVSFQWYLYRKKKNASRRIMDLADRLEESCYIAEVIPKPREMQNEAYYYALKKACRFMNDKIGKIEEEKREYQEYIESFAHEIKIPIGALSLTFDNAKNYTLKKETDKMFGLVEQMLYYARSEDTEKDYFIKQLNLKEVMHNAILKFRHSLMEKKVVLDIQDIDHIIYTDEKWLAFILSQIMQNAIKYFDKQENHLRIYSQDNETQLLLMIEDNGCGIKASDLSRVFEKGFTGSDRKKTNATGIGLYLSKKLCGRLGLEIQIASVENEYTRVTLVFPKGSMHSFTTGNQSSRSSRSL
ncbi:MAG: sensor histidine kinase [Lachnospiraceae bacterium]|nr:sensor histidine kinase [Lachnospiraceae bacterium]